MPNEQNIIDRLREFVDYVVTHSEENDKEKIDFVAVAKINNKDGLSWKMFSSVDILLAADMLKSISNLTYAEVTDDCIGGDPHDEDDVG